MVLLSKLRKANECNRSVLKIINDSELIQLAKEGLCPHYILRNPITGEESLWFVPSEITEWFEQNHTRAVAGNFIPEIKFIDLKWENAISKVPLALRALKDLYELPFTYVATPPGIYFLCLNGSIQYIGQAKNVMNRVSQHFVQSQKYFDSVFFIPCPLKSLDVLETTLIQRYSPKLNRDLGPYGSKRSLPILDIFN